MSRQTAHNGPAPTTLLKILRRAHRNIALLAVTIIGICLTLTGALMVRTNSDDRLTLIAKAISYTAEAAVVFDDRAAALQALTPIAAAQGLADARITGQTGAVLAQWRAPAGGLYGKLSRWTMTLLWQRPVRVSIQHEGAVIGMVEVTGDGRSALGFLLADILAIIICQALIIASAVYLSRRKLDRIIDPLRQWADVAHAVRLDKTFEQRVPPSHIAELNELGEEFNALLSELARWQSYLQSENAALAYQASHDSLTHLPNRAFFETRLQTEIAKAAQNKGKLAVLFMDCDQFKTINDRHGHAAGDAVLAGIAARIKACVRATDLAIRLGGDEFALLVTPLQGIDDATMIAETIGAAMAAPIALPSGERVAAALSIGIAVYPDNAADAHSLVSQADRAMYRAKIDKCGGVRMAAAQDDARGMA
jgi:diguanylate cyclase (GGDEF)-like protein